MTSTLTLTITDSPRYILANTRYCMHLLLRLVPLLGLRTVRAPWYHRLLCLNPYILAYPTRDDSGDSGLILFIPLRDSFIALDTWPERGSATLVIVSCKEFDPQTVASFAVEEFEALAVTQT